MCLSGNGLDTGLLQMRREGERSGMGTSSRYTFLDSNGLNSAGKVKGLGKSESIAYLQQFSA